MRLKTQKWAMNAKGEATSHVNHSKSNNKARVDFAENFRSTPRHKLQHVWQLGKALSS